MRKVICIVTVCFIILVMLPGCGVLQKLGLKESDNDELQPVSSIVMNEDEAKKLTDKVPVRIYFATADNTKLKLEIRYVPVSEAKKSVNNLAALIIKELINGPGADTGLKATIPEGTELRGPIKIEAGVATVDLTKEFVDKHPGGKDAEKLTIYSIVNSLTELKEIQQVRFTINGKAVKDFKGNFQFDAPFPRSPALISMDTVDTSSGLNDEPDEAINEELSKGEAKDKSGESKETGGEVIEDGGEETFEGFDEGSEETYIEILE